jgi:hypothetical protein
MENLSVQLLVELAGFALAAFGSVVWLLRVRAARRWQTALDDFAQRQIDLAWRADSAATRRMLSGRPRAFRSGASRLRSAS